MDGKGKGDVSRIYSSLCSNNIISDPSCFNLLSLRHIPFNSGSGIGLNLLGLGYLGGLGVRRWIVRDGNCLGDEVFIVNQADKGIFQELRAKSIWAEREYDQGCHW